MFQLQFFHRVAVLEVIFQNVLLDVPLFSFSQLRSFSTFWAR